MVFLFIAYFVFRFSVVGQIKLIDDESDKLESDSRSSGTYSFPDFSLRVDDYVVIFLGSGNFAPTEVDSKGG